MWTYFKWHKITLTWNVCIYCFLIWNKGKQLCTEWLKWWFTRTIQKRIVQCWGRCHTLHLTNNWNEEDAKRPCQVSCWFWCKRCITFVFQCMQTSFVKNIFTIILNEFISFYTSCLKINGNKGEQFFKIITSDLEYNDESSFNFY